MDETDHIKAYAHSLEGRPRSEWQALLDHLKEVSKMAGTFAGAFGSGSWAETAGFFHDLGKFSLEFQQYLSASSGDYHQEEISGRVDHSTAGAQFAVQSNPVLGHILAYAIAGHHAGLLDGISDGACLQKRLVKTVNEWKSLAENQKSQELRVLPDPLQNAIDDRDPFAIAFFTRMIFSCLVDADYLDTERFMNPIKYGERPQWPADILQKMSETLETLLEAMETHAEPGIVNQERGRVHRECVEQAGQEPGFFSLTVPTGGGKTLSSLAFALHHAVAHDLKRVIYVIPFTSIIEQNAEVFRKVFAPLLSEGYPDPVIEHHSNIDAGVETIASRLVTENWDAPLIVTTSVQFYESLFSSRPSRCRKLHNIANSVVILDEAQTLPVDLLHPCLKALSLLSNHYQTSIVLCTATQPAIQGREDFSIGLTNVREIIRTPEGLYKNLRRVEVRDLGEQNDSEIVKKLKNHSQVLCIVNTRRHAQSLFRLVVGEQDAAFHLSALMCPAHRTSVLDEIRERLSRNLPCTVISTQLIEAGVDIDFPVVYRSMAGLDSIAQAAGRCNRNGRQITGELFLFRSEHTRAERYFQDTAGAGAQVLGLGLYTDPLGLDAVEHYFRLYYWSQESRWDRHGIVDHFNMVHDRELPFLFDFTTVSRKFRLIEETGRPLIIPWGEEGGQLCEKIRIAGKPMDRMTLRALQRFTIKIPIKLWESHISKDIELLQDQYPVLISPELHYSNRTGLSFDNSEPVLLQI